MTQPDSTTNTGAVEALHPGHPRYEAARVVLAEELREIGKADSRNGFTRMADDLMAGDLMQVQTWIVLQLLARTTPTPASEAEVIERAVAVVLGGRCTGCNRAVPEWQPYFDAQCDRTPGDGNADKCSFDGWGTDMDALAAAIRALSPTKEPGDD